MYCFEPMVNFYPGKALGQRSMLCFDLSLATKDARGPLIRMVGIAPTFVAMRIAKEKKKPLNQPVQCMLFEDDNYTYRIFCTNLAGRAHEVIDEYDNRADVENLVGEAKREGLEMIPSGKFKNNYAFFQIVMLAYNIWRYMKMVAHRSL